MKTILILGILIFSISLISSLNVGIDGEIGVNLIPAAPTNYSIKNVNSSEYWDGMGTINATQMEDSGSILTILESWFSTLFDTLFSAKTTDDLTEGSTNLYANQSWNESAVGTNFGDIFINDTGDTITGNLNIVSANITLNNTYIIDANSSSRIYTEGETWVVVG